MTSQTMKYALHKTFNWTRALGLTAFATLLAGLLARPLQATTDDAAVKLNSNNGSTEFAIQDSGGVDRFMVTSQGLSVSASAQPANPTNGTNATCTWGANSTANYGFLNLVMGGAGTANAALCTVTPGYTAPHAIVCTLTPQNAAAAKIPINDGDRKSVM